MILCGHQIVGGVQEPVLIQYTQASINRLYNWYKLESSSASINTVQACNIMTNQMFFVTGNVMILGYVDTLAWPPTVQSIALFGNNAVGVVHSLAFPPVSTYMAHQYVGLTYNNYGYVFAWNPTLPTVPKWVIRFGTGSATEASMPLTVQVKGYVYFYGRSCSPCSLVFGRLNAPDGLTSNYRYASSTAYPEAVL